MGGGFKWFDSFRFSLSGQDSAVLPLVKWLDVADANEAHVLVVLSDLSITGGEVTTSLLTCPIVSEVASSYVTCASATEDTSSDYVAQNLSAMRLYDGTTAWRPPQGVLGVQLGLDAGTASGLVEAYVVLKQ